VLAMPHSLTADITAVRPSDVAKEAYGRLSGGDRAGARLLLQQGFGRWPQAGALRLLEARILESEGLWDEARLTFRDAAERLREEAGQAPKAPYPAANLAQALAKCGDLPAAGAALQMARDRGLDHLSGLRTERMLAAAAQDWPAMRRAAERVISVQAALLAQDFVALADACRNMNDVDGAMAASALADLRDPKSIQRAITAAWVADQQGDSESAVMRFRDLCRLDPDNVRWAFMLTQSLALLGCRGQAERHLDQALRRWPTNPRLRALARAEGFIDPELPEPVRSPSSRRRAVTNPPRRAASAIPQAVAADPILRHLRIALERIYLDRIERIVLFGSRARGDARPDSDYDIAVFLRDLKAGDLTHCWREMDRLLDLRWQILEKTKAVINGKPYPAGAYQDRTILMREIRRDGIDL
jgi:uncharacterized protein